MNRILNIDIYKFKNRFCFVLVVAIVISLLFSFLSFAATADDYIATVGGKWAAGGMGEFTFKCHYWVYGGIYESILTNNYFLIDTTAPYWQTFTNVYDTFSTLGVLLALLWVVLDMLEKAQFDSLTPEVMIRFFIKFIIAMMLIQNAATIMTELINGGNYLFQKVVGAIHGAAGALDPTLKQAAEDIAKQSFLKCIGTLIELLLPFVFTIVAVVLMYVLLFGRILELGVRFMFTPIGIADIFTHGIQSPGMRYIKKFCAVALQGVVMIAILLAGSKLASTVATDPNAIVGLDVFTQVIILISMLGAMMKSQQISNDILGV